MLGYIRANLLACILGLAAAIFLVIAVVQSVQLNGFLWLPGIRDKLETCETNRRELRAEMDRISKEKNEQAERTEGNIEKAENGRKRSETIAKRLEAAPLPGNCATPKEILEADI